ncbi:hypothetical protein PAAG_05578 [Paracoccidioides lutzii Pb01]|uniref:Trichothecene 3-O-acetyltransferase-like N-terminal domain-containing protein n=1 Tax=Paracoccidioides lutzii (strain ATCC MYA-826 / Pb01) TaxID=502779 RepID=C1H485_PARBA|nr:hypothetical protein PAAG_05578 [Paracoccidioides lutzii Pb01]EEH34529.2 hypothetical protein PAAG_05578 [Paracoccidioides lutzii Pb01]
MLSTAEAIPLDMNVPRLYGVRWILCFSLLANVDKAQIYEGLKLGLAHTIYAIPWIAGNVSTKVDPKGIRSQVVDGSGGVKFLSKDLSGILPSYAELQNKHFPLSKFQTAQLATVAVIPEPPHVYDPISKDRTPLMTGYPVADLARFSETAASAFSTNDALCAFLWQRMTRARNPTEVEEVDINGNSKIKLKMSSLFFSVNRRRRRSPPLPPTYLGNVFLAVTTERLPISILTATDSDSGLCRAAATIRRSLNTINSPNRVPLEIGLVDSQPNPTDYKVAYSGFLGPDISATS